MPLRPATLAVCLPFCLGLWTAHAHAQNAALIQKGQRVWQQRCTDCHALDTDETGPRHRGVFGRRAGAITGYDYSRALKRSQVTWDAPSLDRWLTDPEQFIPGQNMDYRVRSAADRAAVIAYLQSLSAGGAPVTPVPAQSSHAKPGMPRR